MKSNQKQQAFCKTCCKLIKAVCIHKTTANSTKFNNTKNWSVTENWRVTVDG